MAQILLLELDILNSSSHNNNSNGRSNPDKGIGRVSSCMVVILVVEVEHGQSRGEESGGSSSY